MLVLAQQSPHQQTPSNRKRRNTSHSALGHETGTAMHLQRALGNQAVQRLLRARADDVATAPPLVHEVLRTPGEPLDAATRAFMEPRFGQDFSRVRVHHDEKSARSVNALAYTVGNHIVFGAGQHDLSMNERRRLVAHELAHVAQQRDQPASATAPARTALTVSNTGDPAEREADAFASRVISHAGPAGAPAHAAAPSVVYRQEVKSADPRCGNTRKIAAADLNAEGKLAHLYIQADYAVKPGGDVQPEYGIPNSTAKGYMGWVDIADIGRRMMYEIKASNATTLSTGYGEAAAYVDAANSYCGGGWKLGSKYTSGGHLVAVDPAFGSLYAWQHTAGLIAYEWRKQTPVPVKAKEPAKEKEKEQEKAKPEAKLQPAKAAAVFAELDAIEARLREGLPTGGPVTLLDKSKITVEQVKEVLIGLGLLAASATAVYAVILAAPVVTEAAVGLTELVGTAAVAMKVLQRLGLAK